ncbi:elongation factor Tu [Plasmodium brasilianum]|uniref:Elongation factor Tu, putative n=2 Tax=Plasmodium (Plasmodium) TaxID=418103 RepID=A0A1A8VZ21_PLAMA|nr:elongation factor Tu, putative [Plasmodium malariae]KAI4839543.1 elongation factor Tu [Plasmodium brasilianum]SBS84106.1 elongation factor Tu, putative [Plasmodium malariae]SBT87965.1 elongation factor Tu, putative [Plasmodium malariae]
MSNKKRGKNLVYDYEDDFEDYDNYDEEHYNEFSCEEKCNVVRTKKNVTIKKVEKKEKVNLKKEQVKITLKKSEDKKYIMLNTINILVLGHIDAGKSTLIGALLYNLNYVLEQTIKKYENVRESAKFTYILDEEEDERERNITLFNKKKEFFIYYTKDDIIHAYHLLLNKENKGENWSNANEKNSNKKVNKNENIEENEYIYMDKQIFEDFYKRKIIHNDIVCFRKINIFDTPGHNELIHNLHSCSFFADCAILVVDANNIYNKKNDETYRNVSILKSVGISNVIVAINKIDLFDYNVNVFEDICTTILSFFECKKNDSIYEFVLDNNFYMHKEYSAGLTSKRSSRRSSSNAKSGYNNACDLVTKNIIFTPLSAYNNKNIVKFEKGDIPLFNHNFSLYDEIKYINLKKDLFIFKLCEELLYNKKNVLTSYYNFIINNNLFSNNTFYNSGNEGGGGMLTSIEKSLTENYNNAFVGVIHDFTESNNMINASIKVLGGFLKTKNNYTILPFKEKITIKKIEKNMCFYKYINIDNLCDFLAHAKDLNLTEKLLLELSNSVLSANEIEKKNVNAHDNKNCTNLEPEHNLKQNDLTDLKNFINILPELVKNCSHNENMNNITNDIIDNVFLKIHDNKINYGCVVVNTTTNNNENYSSCIMNTIFTCNKMKALIKMNDIRIPLIIGRQYLLYSLTFSHSITIRNVYYVYKNKNSSINSEDTQNNNLVFDCDNKCLADICNTKNYVKKNNTFYERIENKKCLRSHDTGIIEIEVNSNSDNNNSNNKNNNCLMSTQFFRTELNYFISFDNNPFFNIYDFLSFSISPLSRFILSEENKIVASGLILNPD